VKEVVALSLGRKNALATALIVLSVLVFFSTQQRWNVWLVGASHRWAAVAVLLLGCITCALGSHMERNGALLLGTLGAAALALAVAAIATGSLTLLAFLVVDEVVLWAAATVRHAGRRQVPVGT
jgi:hypothetical protein